MQNIKQLQQNQTTLKIQQLNQKLNHQRNH